jgi:hypothetical protein
LTKAAGAQFVLARGLMHERSPVMTRAATTLTVIRQFVEALAVDKHRPSPRLTGYPMSRRNG